MQGSCLKVKNRNPIRLVKKYYENGTFILLPIFKILTYETYFVGIFHQSNGVIDLYFLHDIHPVVANRILA